MSTTATPAHLSHFQSALSTLYGPLDSTAVPDPAAWSPPPTSGGHKGRYLWTDAFGVLNLLTLHTELNRTTTASTAPSNRYLVLAARLIETVHETLGRTRDGSARLPGATDANPLGGGLRIGKLDAGGRDGDGQYHHYLTLWMFALNRMAVASGEARYNALGVALARAIHAAFFVNRGSERARMVWKMDVNLDRVLVGSEGNLDPIDGFVVFRLLQAAAAANADAGEGQGQGQGRPVLAEEIEDYHRIMKRKGKHFVSSDPLDLGMTLWTVHWFAEEEWAAELAERCFEQIYDLIEIDRYLERSTKYRLAFREFGTALGVRCMAEQETEKERAVDLRAYGDRILAAWEPYMEGSLAGGATPQDLRPITRAMYAAAIIPGAFQRGYLGPEPKL
ncbi:uncharacterized protein BJX67DRAFT_377752 [Aspergillus lucknowensis]|uniref:Uncharacterized protein n=1 Tax=Aspergillus lucknowensis TaxID=176173 RepID=A0ABR4M3H4_9EURO